MKKSKCLIMSVVLISLFFPITLTAQISNYILDKQEQKRTIDSISSKLRESYIFPETADKMSQLITDKFKKNKYKPISDPHEFAKQLTTDLQSVSKDLHLRVMYVPKRVSEEINEGSNKAMAAPEERRVELMKRNNFGFKEVKILEGNIGYLDLREFTPTMYGGETAVAAMNFLSNADALIIDLRRNGGGSPNMVQLITSYLVEPNPVHLNNFYYRPTNQRTQTWTLPHVTGKRRPDIDVYVLTSKATFSAAEEFSYNLKNLQRATLIGETTGGGAHSGGVVSVTDKYDVWIPTGRAINPITNSNWEGVGVKPHIEVPGEQALVKAQVAAFENLLKKAEGTSKSDYYKWHLTVMQAKMNPVALDESSLKNYVGVYGNRNISYENGQLFYQRDGQEKFTLIPMGNNSFVLDKISSLKIQFVKDNEDVIALVAHYDNGSSDKSLKSK